MTRFMGLAAAVGLMISATVAQAQECGDLDNSGQIVATDALLLLQTTVGLTELPALECPVLPVLPATGQTICYDTPGAEIECAGTGQDGELQKGAPRSFTDNGDGTVTDDVTGLMWEKLSDDGSIHDRNNGYTWDDAFATKVATLNSTSFAGHNDWRVPNRVELESLVNLGTTEPATYSAFLTNCAPGCTVATCSCPDSPFAWSSTTYAFQPWNALTLGLRTDGSDHIVDKLTDFINVRAVRSGFSTTVANAQQCGDLDNSGQIVATDALLLLQTTVGLTELPALECPVLPVLPATGQTICYDTPGAEVECAGTGQDGELQKGAPRSFTDNGDGTVTDDVTGLMWEKLSDDGSIHDRDNEYNWDGAFTTKVATLNSTSFAGHNDWRVPNRLELETLTDYASPNVPSTYSAFNTNCAPACTVLTCSCPGAATAYWSSTTYAGLPAGAWWVVDSYSGGSHTDGKTNGVNVRAVRGGS